MEYGKLRPIAFGLALGIAWGLSLLIVALVAMYTQHFTAFVTAISTTMYEGYAATVQGAIVGGLWGLLDAFIGGLVIAWLYNCFAFCSRCK